MKIVKVLAGAMMVLVLAGCGATKTSQYYTLQSSDVDPQGSRQLSTAIQNKFVISVQPVSVPEQVERPQIVISRPDSAEVIPLNSSLWASPLTDELRNALASDLSHQLGVLDVAIGGLPQSLAVWKIFLDVQRFESIYGQQVVLDATWRVTPINQPGKHVGLCRAEVQMPVASGMGALVSGHQKALHELASLIAQQLQGKRVTATKEGVQLKGCTF